MLGFVRNIVYVLLIMVFAAIAYAYMDAHTSSGFLIIGGVG